MGEKTNRWNKSCKESVKRETETLQDGCAFALSMLERRAAGGSDGDLRSLHDVVAVCRHLPLTAM